MKIDPQTRLRHSKRFECDQLPKRPTTSELLAIHDEGRFIPYSSTYKHIYLTSPFQTLPIIHIVITIFVPIAKMRPSSPLSLLLFLQLSTAFPVSRECFNSQSCNSLHSVKDTLSLSHPKPSDPRDPHFPNHQKLPIPTFVKPTTTSPLNDEYFAEEGAFDNAPTTPSNDISADEALSAETPLSSSYLQSLTRTSDEDEARPSMPTSALPTLRKEDARKYWEEKPGGLGMNEGKPGCGNSNVWPGTAVGYRTRLAHLDMGGRNDFMVVGIVVVFLLVVCVLESVERFG